MDGAKGIVVGEVGDGEALGRMVLNTVCKSGAERLREIPSSLPPNGEAGAEERKKNVEFLRHMIDEFEKLPLDRVDTLILGYRIIGEDGFFIGGSHNGNVNAIFALSQYLDEQLEAKIEQAEQDEKALTSEAQPVQQG